MTTAFQRIVLIDDNDDDNVYHSIVIRQAGFTGEIVTLEDGDVGLDFLLRSEKDVPTLVFLDINMPRMNGFEVAERAADFLRDTRTTVIVMLTSSGAAYDRERAGSLEVIKGFLTKPLTSDQVLDLMRD